MIAPTDTLQPLRQLLDDLRASTVLARGQGSHEAVLTVLERSAQAYEAAISLEGAHLESRLASDAFPFEEAQSALRQCRAELAGLLLTAQEVLFARLSPDDRRQLTRQALVALRAPLADLQAVARVRDAQASVLARRGV